MAGSVDGERVTADTPLKALDLNADTLSRLRLAGCEKVGDVLGRTTDELVRLPNMFRSTVHHLDRALDDCGLCREERRGVADTAVAVTTGTQLSRLGGLRPEAVTRLRDGGCATVGDALSRSTIELLRLPYVGWKIVRELDTVLGRYGLARRDEAEEPQKAPAPAERRVMVQLAAGELPLMQGWLGVMDRFLVALAESARATGAHVEVVRWLERQAALARGRVGMFDRPFYPTAPKVLPEAKPVFMSRSEAAKYLRCSEATLQRWAREGVGPRVIRIGRQPVYEQGELVAFVRSGAVEAKRIERDGE
jgi:hypothetical protein